MKSASSAVSGSEQQYVQRPAIDVRNTNRSIDGHRSRQYRRFAQRNGSIHQMQNCRSNLRQKLNQAAPQRQSPLKKESHMSQQLKYNDIGELSEVTNTRCAAEQIKGDKDENIATGGVNIEEFGKLGKSENSKVIVMGGEI